MKAKATDTKAETAKGNRRTALERIIITIIMVKSMGRKYRRWGRVSTQTEEDGTQDTAAEEEHLLEYVREI